MAQGGSARCDVAVWMRGEPGGGGMDACTHMAESLCGSPETTTTLLTSYTQIQNQKLFKIPNAYFTMIFTSSWFFFKKPPSNI